MTTLLGPVVDNAENALTVTIGDGVDPTLFVVVYSVYVPSLLPEDVVLVRAQFELTNNTGGLVSLGRFILRTNSPTSTMGTRYVTPSLNNTFPPALHHEVPLLVGIDTGMPAGDYYYNVVVSAKSAGSNQGQTLQIEPGYGSCSAVIFDRP